MLSRVTSLMLKKSHNCPDSKAHGANTGPTWGRQDPGGPHVGPINLFIWVPQDHWSNSEVFEILTLACNIHVKYITLLAHLHVHHGLCRTESIILGNIVRNHILLLLCVHPHAFQCTSGRRRQEMIWGVVKSLHLTEHCFVHLLIHASYTLFHEVLKWYIAYILMHKV